MSSPIGNTSSPVVDQSWKKRESWKNAHKCFQWGFINIFLAFLIYLEMSFTIFRRYLERWHPLLWYIECILLAIFSLNAAFDFLKYIWAYISTSPVEVNLHQKHLLGVGDKDLGFSVSPVKSQTPSSEKSTIFSNSPGQTPYSPSSSPWGSSGLVTPTNPGSFSGSFSYPSPQGSFSSMSTPGNYDKSYGKNNVSFSPNLSFSSNMTTSPYHSSGHFSSLDSSGLRSRNQSLSLPVSSFRSSPSSSYEVITDQNALTQYLQEQDEKDSKASLGTVDLSLTGGFSSFWSYGSRPSLDYTHMLRKYTYQVASRSPQSSKSRADDSDQASTMGNEVWRELDVTEDDLYLWIERLRKWLCQTIVSRVSEEIITVNAALTRIGCEDTEIGEVSISTLKHLELTKGTLIPTLNSLLPYLDFPSPQEYMVQRIKDLGKDGCISEFSWASGGNYGKHWGEHLPTDAALVMHLFCTYLDSRLPAQPKYPDGKTFTNQYFMKTPDKPNLEKKDNFLIYQSSINPPHFQVIIKNNVFSLPKGRNNMFQAMLLFLYHIQTREHGMLGRVSLGMSGVNILNIFDS
ncbi:hypothetical protein ACJMK2_016240 [Sinanodonta woodiana]|uniref:Transmembrane protein 209 n=1 Tax=Sinanodonta woodiana TaxID=1069815 RepID=A0ABD3UWM3_SINWO